MATDTYFTRIASSALLVASMALGNTGLAQSPQDGPAEHANTQIGTVDFQVSCDGAVREDFNQALGLMHHMMYTQARSAFQAITQADPDCAMAYWGVATTLFQPLWGTRPTEEELQQGWRNIEKARELGPSTERDRLLVEATAAFIREPPTREFPERMQAWIEGMETAYQSQADDHDTAALYALSRLALAQTVDNRQPLLEEAEAILRDVWEQEPRHPGAIHYVIHATDADNRAENALDMVQAYTEIAPEVPHAMHMPSHIHVRLGDWPKVIDWNRRSADAALQDQVNGAISHHYIHAMDYLLYAYLQQGKDDKALAVAVEAKNKGRHQASFIGAFHVSAIPARTAVERREWEAAMALVPRAPAYLPWDESTWAEALTWYARGLGGVHTGNLALARDAEQRLDTLREQALADGDENFATYIEVDRRILAGWIQQANGQSEAAMEQMRSAAELEGTIEKHPVSPGALLPPNEALGDLLMDLNRPAEALEAYQAADAIWPGRYNTLLGAARAARQAGDEDAAQDHYTQLLEIAEDSDRAGVSEARQFVADQQAGLQQ